MQQNGEQTARQSWIAVLARSTTAELERFAEGRKLPRWELVKGPETGIVMIEARAGGTGRRFNLGEATTTRAVVQLASGTLGVSYALGTDQRKAELAAVFDALLQEPSWSAEVERELILPLARRQTDARQLASRRAAATKVDFFTLQRGDG